MATPKFSFPSATASISWLDASGNTMVRVYSSDGYHVTEQAWDGGGWSATGFKQPGADVSATCQMRASGTPWIRVYCTGEEKTVEWCSDDGSTWYQGAYPSPGS